MNYFKIFVGVLPILLLTVVMTAFAAEGKRPVTSTAAWWDQLSYEKKVETVQTIIDHFKKSGIVVRKEPTFYVEEFDAVRLSNPQILALPIGSGLRTLFIMYRDFDNGHDPNELLREVLGEEEYERYLEQDSDFGLELIYQDWCDQHGLAEPN